MLAAALETLGLSKRFGRAWALRDVDLGIPTGATCILVGPNGAGKSTLIRTWLGFERPTEGQVLVAGLDPKRSLAEVLSHLGYVPQRPGLYPGLSVSDHLSLAEKLRPLFDRDAAAARLSMLGIAPMAMATALSGGQQAQVLLSIALSCGADILLLDEPLASLDPLARREFVAALEKLVRDADATALVSSHAVLELEGVADHIVVLGQGCVLLSASVGEALTNHLVTSSPEVDSAIGRYRNSAGVDLALVHSSESPIRDGEQRASLEDIVLGYLSSAQVGRIQGSRDR